MVKVNTKPFSDNIIFFDTEFSGNDISAGEVLSIGMVKPNGDELYIELEFNGKVSGWVKKNILPTLISTKTKRDKAIKNITEFAGVKRPYLMSYITPYDTVYLHKLLGAKDFDKYPFHAWPIDFATILFANGIDPDSLKSKKIEKFTKSLGIDITKYHLHHALDDAKLLREVYLKMLMHK